MKFIYHLSFLNIFITILFVFCIMRQLNAQTISVSDDIASSLPHREERPYWGDVITIALMQANPLSIEKNNVLRKNKGWRFGVNFGAYFANKSTANFYNGTGDNNIQNVFNNPHYEKQILEVLKINDKSEILYKVLPTDMKYDPAMLLGLFIKYNFNKKTGLFIQFNYSKLKAADVFTLVLEDYTQFEPEYKICNIYGIEERINIDLGLSTGFELSDNYMYLFEAGLNINDTKVLESKIQIENLKFSIVDYTAIYYKIVQGGIGYGGFIGSGLDMKFSEQLSLYLGGNLYIKKINLGDDPGYKPNFSIFLRLIVKNIFGGDD